MNPLLIAALISGALGFGSAWTWQGYRQDAYKLEVSNENLVREQSARRALADAEAKNTATQLAFQAAADRARADADRTARSAVGVRNALANSVRAATVDLTTCTAQVTTISELFTASTELSRRIGQEADGWANQAVTLQSAWPK